MITIVDFGMGNLRSVAQALQCVAPDAPFVISQDPDQIRAASRLILPGQGAMLDCVRNLRALGLETALREALAQKPVLAVCIGEQMLFERSEEADAPGLGIFAGTVTKLTPGLDPNGLPYKVPHMGWNTVRQTQAHALWRSIPDQTYFYFVHSYRVCPAQTGLQAGETDYGGLFTSAVAKDNIFAVQFHPEKSAQAGLQIYQNFVHWNP